MIDITPEAELFHQFGNFEEVEYLDLMEHILSKVKKKKIGQELVQNQYFMLL